MNSLIYQKITGTLVLRAIPEKFDCFYIRVELRLFYSNLEPKTLFIERFFDLFFRNCSANRKKTLFKECETTIVLTSLNNYQDEKCKMPTLNLKRINSLLKYSLCLLPFFQRKSRGQFRATLVVPCIRQIQL
jgi:hypothetical protein